MNLRCGGISYQELSLARLRNTEKRRMVDSDAQEVTKLLTNAGSLNITMELADILQRYGNLIYFLQSETHYLSALLSAVDQIEADQLIQVHQYDKSYQTTGVSTHLDAHTYIHSETCVVADG